MALTRSTLRALLPRPFRRYLADRLEYIRRTFPGAPRGLPKFGLASTQVYPAGNNFDSVLLAASCDKLRNVAIHPKTRIASIGTCFAEEFSFYMIERKFNY